MYFFNIKKINYMNYQILSHANYITLKRNSIEALNPVNSIILPYNKNILERILGWFKTEPLKLKEIYLKPRIKNKPLRPDYLRKMIEKAVK